MKKIIFLITISIVALSSCHKDISLSDDTFKKQIVINSLISPYDSVGVNVSYSAPPGQIVQTNFMTYLINDAEVGIYENNNLLSKLKNKLYETSNSKFGFGNYISYVNFKENQEYEIRAKHGEHEVSANIKFPNKASDTKLSVVDLSGLEIHDFGNKTSIMGEIKINLEIDDKAGKDYYMIYLYSKRPNYKINSGTGEFTDTVLSYDDIAWWIEEDESISNNQKITANIPGVQHSSYIYNDIMFSQQKFIIKTTVLTNGTNIILDKENNLKIYYRVYTLSDDLFKFYISLDKHQSASGTPFAEPVNIYTNVKNGLGLVAGYNYTLDSISIPITRVNTSAE